MGMYIYVMLYIINAIADQSLFYKCDDVNKKTTVVDHWHCKVFREINHNITTSFRGILCYDKLS